MMRVVLFGVLSWLSGRRRREERARQKELSGELERAAQLYLEAEMPDDAARVLLLKADAEVDPEKRMVLCAQAARVGGDGPQGSEAARRKALLGFDLLKAARGATMHGEILRVAAELEGVGQWQAAVEAYRLAGDTDGEIRVLKEAGAIDQLEERLQASSDEARRERDRAALLRRMRDLDAIAERRNALAAGRAFLAQQGDEQVELELERIRSKLLAGPVVTLQIDGAAGRYVLGSQVTIGRAHADIVVAANAVSRQHLSLGRHEGAAMVEDLATRNGTTLAGARIEGAMPVGSGLSLELAGQVPCRIRALAGLVEAPLEVDVAGERYVVPLGPLRVGRWQVVDAHDGDDRFVVLRTPPDAEPPCMGDLRLAREIELSVGDRIRAARSGAVVLAVPAQAASGEAVP